MSTEMKNPDSPLRQKNQKILERQVWANEDVAKFRESVKKQFGFDMKDEKAFPVTDPNFSMSKLKSKLALREADSGSSFVQVLRAGVQTLVNSLYQSVPVTYTDWVHVGPSTKDTELYAPIQGISFPSQVGEQEKYPESFALGLDIKLRNRKFGQVYPVARELLEDDQTGQFQKLAGLMAEYAAQVVEVYCYGKLASATGMAYSNLSVPTSETKPSEESTYPWSTSLVGGGKNRPSSFGALTQANIQTGIVALMNQLNKLGLKMSVDPSALLISPHYRFDVAVLLHSAYYPAGAAAAGVTGGAFAINPIQGVATPIISRFMFDNNGSVNADSKAWYLMDRSKPWFICQMREPASVMMEAENQGQSFDRDVVRWKLRTRMNADHIDPRFAWQGSDGSA